MRNVQLLLTFPAMAALIFICVSSGASAQSNSSISQQYQTSQAGITAASLVSIQQGSTNTVELATSNTANKLAGIVGSKPLIELSDGKNGVQVVTSGVTMALVSDINGSVITGDKITASPIAGVGMKATADSVVVGTVQESLKNVPLETRSIVDKTGKAQDVHIGLLPLQVNVAFYSQNTGKSTSYVPSFLQSIANNLAGRSVSETRVLIAGLVLLFLFFGVAALLYSSVRSSIIAIGRNPLSAHAVRKSLLEVSLTALALIVFATIIVYLVLTV